MLLEIGAPYIPDLVHANHPRLRFEASGMRLQGRYRGLAEGIIVGHVVTCSMLRRFVLDPDQVAGFPFGHPGLDLSDWMVLRLNLLKYASLTWINADKIG